jgi:hypothetical protein
MEYSEDMPLKSSAADDVDFRLTPWESGLSEPLEEERLWKGSTKSTSSSDDVLYE